jgi:hypothetical protein
MIRHTGGHRFCPNCKRIVETRVQANGYGQAEYRGGYAKQRKIICAKDRHGNGGCGYVWVTLEIPQELLREIAGILMLDLETATERRRER